jgi:hypothetical protein
VTYSFISNRGIALGSPQEFGSHDEGFGWFNLWIQDLLKSHKLSKLSTGHYWFSLARWLSNKGIQAVLVNPQLVKKNKENRDNTPSISDRKDALVIADMVKKRLLFPLITMFMVMTNPDVRALHHHNVEVKKIKKMKSIMKLCGKVARMLVGLAKSSETYDSTKVFPKAA